MGVRIRIGVGIGIGIGVEIGICLVMKSMDIIVKDILIDYVNYLVWFWRLWYCMDYWLMCFVILIGVWSVDYLLGCSLCYLGDVCVWCFVYWCNGSLGVLFSCKVIW